MKHVGCGAQRNLRQNNMISRDKADFYSMIIITEEGER